MNAIPALALIAAGAILITSRSRWRSTTDEDTETWIRAAVPIDVTGMKNLVNQVTLAPALPASKVQPARVRNLRVVSTRE